nr:M28 Zn-peptidase nicastrin [Tanacetum cinerariifolium]
MMIDNSQAVLDSDEMKKNVVNEANDLMMIPMLDSDLSWYLGIQQVVFGGQSMGDWEKDGRMIIVMIIIIAAASCVVELCDASTELEDHVVEVNLQNDVLDGMFTFYDSTVSTLQIFQFTRDNYQGS